MQRKGNYSQIDDLFIIRDKINIFFLCIYINGNIRRYQMGITIILR